MEYYYDDTSESSEKYERRHCSSSSDSSSEYKPKRKHHRCNKHKDKGKKLLLGIVCVAFRANCRMFRAAPRRATPMENS